MPRDKRKLAINQANYRRRLQQRISQTSSQEDGTETHTQEETLQYDTPHTQGDADEIHSADSVDSDTGDSDTNFDMFELEESDDEAELAVQETRDIQSDLAKFCTDFKLSRVASAELLRLLKQHGHADLPADVRTLISRCSTLQKFQIESSELTYVGIEVCLKKLLDMFPNFDSNSNIELVFNFDGLPLASE